MTRQDKLDILLLLSALESWAFSNNQHLPEFLHGRLANLIVSLSAEVLDSGST